MALFIQEQKWSKRATRRFVIPSNLRGGLGSRAAACQDTAAAFSGVIVQGTRGGAHLERAGAGMRIVRHSFGTYMTLSYG